MPASRYMKGEGDLFEIKGDKEYGSYFKALGIARTEYNNNEAPKVVTDIKDFASYDRILPGFPIWYSKCPQLVISFIDSHDFNGKDVYPFCTSGISGIDGAMPQITESCKGAKVHPGIRVNKVDEEAVNKWLNDKG